MQVKATPFQDVQHVLAHHVPIVEGKDHVRGHLLYLFDPDRVIDVVRRENRNAFSRSQFRDRSEPDILVRVVPVRNDRRDFEAVLQERFNARASDIAVS